MSSLEPEKFDKPSQGVGFGARHIEKPRKYTELRCTAGSMEAEPGYLSQDLWLRNDVEPRCTQPKCVFNLHLICTQKM